MTDNTKRLEQIFLAFLIISGIYMMYLASNTQMLGEDEATYFSLAKDFASGNYPVLTNTNTPIVYSQFMSLLYSFFFIIFGASLATAKAVTALFGILSLVVVYLIGKRFSIYYGIIASMILLSIQTFAHYMMIIYQEVPVAFFSSLILYMFLKMERKRDAIALGAILAISFFTKASMLVFGGIIFLYAIVEYLRTRDIKVSKLSYLSIIVFVLLLTPYVARNIILYQYPYVEGLNFLFGSPPAKYGVNIWADLFSTISPVSLSLSTFVSTFGWLSFALLVFGFSWIVSNRNVKGESKKERNELILLFVFIFGFLAAFTFSSVVGSISLEARYLSIIFPQVSLLGAFFLWKMKEWNKLFLLPIILIIVFSVFTGITVAQTTSQSQRYPQDYLDALKWVKLNTPKDATFFTTYRGSLLYYGERNDIWTEVSEFKELMTTDNSTYIYDTLKNYNVSYILIWSQIVAQDYVIPESNIWGVFTYNFVNTVMSDTDHFESVYSTSNELILKLK